MSTELLVLVLSILVFVFGAVFINYTVKREEAAEQKKQQQEQQAQANNAKKAA